MGSVIALPRIGLVVDRPGTTMLAVILSFCMLFTGCWFNPAWITTALNDLPVLIQMATTIASLVSVVKTNAPPTQQETWDIQNISNVARNGLLAIQALYNSYKAGNSTAQDIVNAGNALSANLKQLLAAAQIKDQALAARVTVATNLVITAIDTIISLVPQGGTKVSRASMKAAARAIPTPSQLKADWAQKVGVALVAHQ